MGRSGFGSERPVRVRSATTGETRPISWEELGSGIREGRLSADDLVDFSAGAGDWKRLGDSRLWQRIFGDAAVPEPVPCEESHRAQTRQIEMNAGQPTKPGGEPGKGTSRVPPPLRGVMRFRSSICVLCCLGSLVLPLLFLNEGPSNLGEQMIGRYIVGLGLQSAVIWVPSLIVVFCLLRGQHRSAVSLAFGHDSFLVMLIGCWLVGNVIYSVYSAILLGYAGGGMPIVAAAVGLPFAWEGVYLRQRMQEERLPWKAPGLLGAGLAFVALILLVIIQLLTR